MSEGTTALFLVGLVVAFALVLAASWRRLQRLQAERARDWEAQLVAETQRAGESSRRLAAAQAEAAALGDEIGALRQALSEREAELRELLPLAEERRRLLEQNAALRAESAEYRQILVDVENHAPPPILAGATDDLKLIVGVGPVLERLLHKYGVTTFRQIANWGDRDIDEFDVRLEEFHGRVRRDDWVTQARELHYQKYGERLAK